MAVHIVRLFVEPPKGESVEAVNNWVENHTHWTDAPISHELTEATADLDGDGTTYARGGALTLDMTLFNEMWPEYWLMFVSVGVVPWALYYLDDQ